MILDDRTAIISVVMAWAAIIIFLVAGYSAFIVTKLDRIIKMIEAKDNPK